jgi:hypothetical protein
MSAPTYQAYVEVVTDDGTQRTEWTGLREGQARWRYHWIRRSWWRGEIKRLKTFGWREEP